MNFFSLMEQVSLSRNTNKIEVPSDIHFRETDYDILKVLPIEELINVLKNTGIINSSFNCPTCNDTLINIYHNADRHPFFRCNRKTCPRKRYSVFHNTIFNGVKIEYNMVLKILYFFSCRRNVSECVSCLNVSKPTVISFYNLFRSSLLYFMDKNSKKVGGSGVVIHFDETPITHRHGLQGTHAPSNTVWVVGCIDIHTRNCFLKFLPSRSRDDLFHFLNLWILPGSIVHTDCHRSYATLSSLGFTHFTVNHSINLVGPDGTHTNWVEGLFGCVKKMRRKYDATWSGVNNLELYLAEFCFRYSHDAWCRSKAFLKICYALSDVREKLNQEERNN